MNALLYAVVLFVMFYAALCSAYTNDILATLVCISGMAIMSFCWWLE